MKYLKLFEHSITMDSIRNIVKQYDDICTTLRPIAIEKYMMLAENGEEQYDENGPMPYIIHDQDQMLLDNIYFDNDKIILVLSNQDDYSDTPDEFHIDFTEEELEDALIKVRSTKTGLWDAKIKK